nr:hypothetical protein B0A51_00489 [Rachicladosporium sp. CCFEE 5018]
MATMRVRVACIALLATFCLTTYALTTEKSEVLFDVGSLSTSELEQQLQKCPTVTSLEAHKALSHSTELSLLQRAFSALFPFSSPMWNSFAATAYISGPPNFLLALVPTNFDPSSLNIMVAFAVGGLLGDTLFHLLPEIFLGEVPQGEVRVRLVEPNKNLLLGVAIMFGFVTFVAMDKGLRIATGGAGHSHDHSQESSEISNGHLGDATAKASALDNVSNGSLRNRKDAVISEKPALTSPAAEPPKKEIKLSAYLNIIADFTHNITDGLALSSSFYASPTIGATTTLAVFCHEIPHEVGDFALLIQGGMSKKMAMALQFVTALGAVLGTCIGVAVQELGGSAATAVAGAGNQGIWGTSLSWGDMLLPFTAGTFLYVGTVGVIPEMLETGPNKMKELRSMAMQFAAMAAGAGIMLGISWD